MFFPPILVIGAGSWGTALALHLARTGQYVVLWDRETAHVHAMQKQRSNERYLPGLPFPDTLEVVASINDGVARCADILLAIPSKAFRLILTELARLLPSHPHPTSRFVWATKGLDPTSEGLLHETFQEILPAYPKHAILSGPSFAKEVAQQLPAALCLASQDLETLEYFQARFHTETFRVYKTSDVIGVELGGAIKNILAVAAGISDGLGFGANARAALLTRGLYEMSRLGQKIGARPETLMGLAGLGDLILTCTDDQSRNRRFGLNIGHGLDLLTAEQKIGQVVEGKETARLIYLMAQKHEVEMPITQEVYQVLFEDKSPQQAVHALMTRKVY